MTMQRRALGAAGELVARRFLEDRGWVIVASNFRRREGEVDIVAVREDVLAFVEVKTRRSLGFGDPCEAVTQRKRARIRSLAAAALAQGAVPHMAEVRFDVVEVLANGSEYLVRHLPGAF